MTANSVSGLHFAAVRTSCYRRLAYFPISLSGMGPLFRCFMLGYCHNRTSSCISNAILVYRIDDVLSRNLTAFCVKIIFYRSHRRCSYVQYLTTTFLQRNTEARPKRTKLQLRLKLRLTLQQYMRFSVPQRREYHRHKYRIYNYMRQNAQYNLSNVFFYILTNNELNKA